MVCGSHRSCHCCSSPSLSALPCLRGTGCSPQGCRLRLPHLTPQPAEYVQRAGERAAACTTTGCQYASEADSAQVHAVVVMARNAAFFSVTTNGIQTTTVCKSGTWRMTARECRCQRTQAESTAGVIHPQAWGKEPDPADPADPAGTRRLWAGIWRESRAHPPSSHPSLREKFHGAKVD